MADHDLADVVYQQCVGLPPSEWTARLNKLREEDRTRVRRKLEANRDSSMFDKNSSRLDNDNADQILETVLSDQVDEPADAQKLPSNSLPPSESPGTATASRSDVEMMMMLDGHSSQEAQSQMIGDYHVLNTIAIHGQGAVYRANHPHLNRQVVIKVSKDRIDKANQEHVLTEGRALASLSHPNLAQVYDLQFEKGFPYLVMEYIEGRNLSEQLKDVAVSPEEAAELVATLARAIDHAHSLGIVHQDLKPANVVIRASDNTPKIIDFGLAKANNAYATESLLSTYGGTIAYMAPEQAEQLLSPQNRDACDERVDIFALGAILYEMLTGKRLYKFDEQLEGLELAKACEFDRTFPTDTPEFLRSACLKALAKDPSDRWPSAAQFAESLQPPKPEAISNHRYLGSVIAAAVLIAGWWLTLGLGHNFFSSDSERRTREATLPATSKGGQTSNGTELLPGIQFVHVANNNNVGTVGRLFENGPVQEDDDLRIEVQFEDHSFCFLFAVNPDGAVQLCYPEGEEQAWDMVQSEPIRLLQYPVDSSLGFPFTDGTGQQAFVLIRSDQPLPSFRNWSASFDNMQNSLTETKGKWIWNNGTVSPAGIQRDGSVRGAPRKLRGFEAFDTMMRTIQASNSDQDISGISFPVGPR